MCPAMRLPALLVSAALVAASAADDVNFNRDIRPLLTENCFHCHGPDPSSRKAGLRLDLADHATRPAKSGAIPIVPGKPEESELLRRLDAPDADDVMPPPETHKSLKPADKDLFRRWIASGARYEGHWAFTPPQRPALPAAPEGSHPIDAFILDRLAREGLTLSPEADRAILARRAAFDLTGLPPEPEWAEEFLRDTRPDAWERYLDRLLASPHYGERWAHLWMDIARYADSAGYGSDPLRLNIWPWRDWVIEAFNRNLPYDRFSAEQLAGDLLPDADDATRLATGFHRNTMTNTEGGTDDEEWRIAAVKDRAGVTAQAWMGLTMNCAQCHSHKFDPISHEEYYRFFALFNQTADADRGDEQPLLPVRGGADRRRAEALAAEIAGLEAALRADTPETTAELAAWEKRRLTPAPVAARLVGAALVGPDGRETSVTPEADGSIRIASPPDKATTRLRFTTTAPRATALRLEALPDAALPGGGPGHSAGGNAVVSEIVVTAAPETPQRPEAQIVRIEAPGAGRFLHLAEVEVFSDGRNVARQGRASQVSTGFGGDAARGIDGNTDGEYFKSNSVTHTEQADSPWWEVDLGRMLPVERVVVWNRTDADTEERLRGWKLVLLDGSRRPVAERALTDPPAPSASIATGDGVLTVPLGSATASFSQDGWTPDRALDGKADTGWAFGPRFGVPHTAVFNFARPVEAEGGRPVTVTVDLRQEYGQRHVLGHFRATLLTSDDTLLEAPEALVPVLAKPASARTPEERRAVADFHRPHARATAALLASLTEKKAALAALPVVGVPVMQELPPDKRRRTHLLNKGNFLDPGQEVTAGFPAAFGPVPDGAPADRRGLVQWLFSPGNPLTSRVAVNRFWAQLFGTGLVETEEDFGLQGRYPSHPALLDWLAVEFRETLRWDMKRLLRLIMTSRTYRQSSRATPELLAKDPAGLLLSRYPRRRLDAAQVRDQALFVGGLLSRTIGGPSVYPPQPDGLWKAAFNGERSYPTSQGADRHRRGLYTIWRRTVPYPSMAAFDAPSRETCTLRRSPTNTPLQAYVTLNDPVYVECAQALARRVLAAAADESVRLALAWRLATSRPPEPAALASLTSLLAAERRRLAADPAAAGRLATEPLGPLPAGMDPVEAAAWTSVANALLNLDAVLTKS